MRDDAAALVGIDALEAGLDGLRPAGGNPAAGFFGPHSLTWRIDREAAVFLGAGRALLLQLAHPWVAAAIAEHSRSLSDPVGRFHRTFRVVFTLVFGTAEEARAAARRLFCRHAAIVGALPAGGDYRANEVAALRWVHATLIDTALVSYELVLPPLAAAERERYWAESRAFAALFGIPLAALPPDWAGFAAYKRAMWRSGVLAVGRPARLIADALFGGAATRLRLPEWYLSLTGQLLPPPLRAAFGFRERADERRAAERALAWIRRLYPLLPARLRYVAPYQEAIGRLAGQPRPDLATRLLNRLWVGHPLMHGGAPPPPGRA
jgi:uncharacterized protein (DUF2236 family)